MNNQFIVRVTVRRSPVSCFDETVIHLYDVINSEGYVYRRLNASLNEVTSTIEDMGVRQKPMRFQLIDIDWSV